MRTLSLVLALGFLIAGSSLAGTADSGLPGIGTFAYNGSPITAAAPSSIVMASRF